MLDRLVGRAVLAEADRIVRHHIDDARLLQRREADRRPRHNRRRPGRCRHRGSRRRAAPCRSSPRPCRTRGCRNRGSGRNNRLRSAAFWPLVLVLFEPVRSAEPPIVSGSRSLIAPSASSDALRVATFCGVGDQRRRYSSSSEKPSGSSPAMRRLELRRAVAERRGAAVHAACAPCAARARAAPGGGDLAGISNGGAVQPSALARGGDLVGAQRGAVGRRGALLVGRAVADDRAAGDQRSGADRRAPRRARARDVGVVMPVAARDVPASSAA